MNIISRSTKSLERPFVISNYRVMFQPWQFNPDIEYADYEERVTALKKVVASMFDKSCIKPIVIEGHSGVGKSTLAEVLKENGEKITIIDPVQLKASGYNVPSSLISDPKTTYIVDECAYCDKDIMIRAEEHALNGGIIILLVQDIRDFLHLDTGFELKVKIMRLTRDKLVETCA